MGKYVKNYDLLLAIIDSKKEGKLNDKAIGYFILMIDNVH